MDSWCTLEVLRNGMNHGEMTIIIYVGTSHDILWQQTRSIHVQLEMPSNPSHRWDFLHIVVVCANNQHTLQKLMVHNGKLQSWTVSSVEYFKRRFVFRRPRKQGTVLPITLGSSGACNKVCISSGNSPRTLLQRRWYTNMSPLHLSVPCISGYLVLTAFHQHRWHTADKEDKSLAHPCQSIHKHTHTL